ncbi:MAG: hypothetical protein ACI8YI_001917, partial [Paracoccaceae bacterium]
KNCAPNWLSAPFKCSTFGGQFPVKFSITFSGGLVPY